MARLANREPLPCNEVLDRVTQIANIAEPPTGVHEVGYVVSSPYPLVLLTPFVPDIL